MNEEKIVNGYYQADIKTSRNEDSVYAMKYASQQMLIDKLEKKIEFLTKRENKLQTIEQMYKSGSVDLDKLRKIVMEEK